MKINKQILLVVLVLSSLVTKAQQEKSTGLVVPSEKQMLKILGFQSEYIQGGEKVYAMTRSSYGDANTSHFDLRDINGVTSVKDQKTCGSCWSFSAIAAIESNNLLVNGANTNLSEQSLLNCVENLGCGGLNSLGGGSYVEAFDWLLKTQSEAVTESQLPYENAIQSCSVEYGNSNIKMANWQFLGNNPSIEEIKNALVRHGALSAGIFCDFSEFYNYKGGVLRGNNYPPGHAINIVGWDDDEQAWLIKNSWGTSWGLDGYAWIGYNSLGLTDVTWADVTRKDVEPELKPAKEDLIELDFVHALGSLQEYQELYVKIDNEEIKRFGMNKKGVKYHNRVYVSKGKHHFQVITSSIVKKDNKKSMLFGVVQGSINATEDKAYKLVYKSRVKKTNVFKLILQDDDIELDQD